MSHRVHAKTLVSLFTAELGNPNNWRGCGRNRDLCVAPARDGVSVEGHIVAQCLLNVTQALWRYLVRQRLEQQIHGR